MLGCAQPAGEAGSLLSCVGSWWENAGTRKALDTWIFEHMDADSGCA